MSTNSQKPLPLPPKYSNDTPEQYLERLMDFYKEYYWLIHVLAFNFVTLREWENFPLEWRDALMKRMEDAGDDWAIDILDLSSETSDYVRKRVEYEVKEEVTDIYDSLFGQNRYELI
jgi:hypothetical protein